MDEFTEPRCVHNHGVVCETRNCGKCGWNPNVDEKRRKAITLMGRDALVKHPEGIDELFSVKYILRNYKEYGGDMVHAEMQKRLGLGHPAYQAEKRKAHDIVKNLIMEAIECM